jgi:hypothetical protein
MLALSFVIPWFPGDWIGTDGFLPPVFGIPFTS